MATVTLDLMAPAFPAITNRIKASVATQASPLAIVASTIDTTAGHPARIYNFTLPRNIYNFSLDEIDGSGAVVRNLSYFAVVPSTISGMLSRDDEQIQVDVTSGLVSTTNTFTFDGTGGKPDYRGWVIVPSELTGRGILALGLDYSWDSANAIFTLLQAGDAFQPNTYWNIHFDPQNNTTGVAPSSTNDLDIELITADTTLTSADFGKKIICEPAGNNILVTLPDAATIPDGRVAYIECGGTGIRHAKFVPQGADTIAFLNRGLYCYSNESFSIYKFTRSVGVYEFRVFNDSGNFKTVGTIISADQIQSAIVNAQMLDGSAKDKYQYARIYEQIVLMLPGAQVVDYDLWSTGLNYTKFSFANSANPANADKFHFPDRRGLYERATSAGTKAGDYLANDNKSHGHRAYTDSATGPGGSPSGFANGGNYPLTGAARGGTLRNTNGAGVPFIEISGGAEARPETIYTNKYVLI